MAQATASSESGFVPVHDLSGGGGLGISVSGSQATGSISERASGPEATSTNYILRNGVAWSAALVGTDVPIVTGVRDAFGDKDGGDGVTVYGFNFDAPGAGLPDVQFSGGAGVNASVTSNTTIDVLTPSALNALGNPLGPSFVSVANSLGSDSATDAYYYLPSLVAGIQPQIGKTLELRAHTPINAIPIFLYGQSIPSFGIPVSPYDGQLECVVGLQLLPGALAPAATGVTTLKLPLPSDQGLIGAPLEFQIISLDDFTLTSGAWSNRLQVTIAP